jgi:hypothetical protein
MHQGYRDGPVSESESPSEAPDPLASLNAVLSEVIDFIGEVKQARFRFAAPPELHAELDALFDDARSWAQLLIVEDDAYGRSALASMPSVAGRQPANLGREASTAEELRGLLEEHLTRLDRHVAEAIAGQDDEELRAALATVEAGVERHQEALRSV